jgi:hypothetical protein
MARKATRPQRYPRVIDATSPPPRRIYFSLLHSGYLRHYAAAIRILSKRGHVVHVATVRPEKHPGDDVLLTELADEYPATFSFGPASERATLDPWRRPAHFIRSLLDIARYAHPDFAQADALRERSIAKLGLGRVSGALLRPLLWRLAATASRDGARRRVARLQWLEDRIPASRAITAELRSFQPDAVLASPVVEFASTQVDHLKSGRALGARTGVCVASWDNLTNKGLLRFKPDKVFVWNELQRREAEEYHAITADEVVVTGAARFDPWFERAPSSAPAEFAQSVGLEPGPYLLYLCSSLFVSPDEVAFVEKWLTALRASDQPDVRETGVLIRPYPHNAEPWRDVDLREFGNVAVYPRVGTHPDRGDAQAIFYDSIAHSRAVVGINTTALIEAAIAGKPAYTILDPQFARTQQATLHFHYLRQERGGFLQEATSLADHVRQLERGLPDAEQEHERIQAFVTSFVRPCGLDRPAAEVIADAFESLAEGARTHAVELAPS